MLLCNVLLMLLFVVFYNLFMPETIWGIVFPQGKLLAFSVLIWVSVSNLYIYAWIRINTRSAFSLYNACSQRPCPCITRNLLCLLCESAHTLSLPFQEQYELQQDRHDYITLRLLAGEKISSNMWKFVFRSFSIFYLTSSLQISSTCH